MPGPITSTICSLRVPRVFIFFRIASRIRLCVLRQPARVNPITFACASASKTAGQSVISSAPKASVGLLVTATSAYSKSPACCTMTARLLRLV